MSEDGRDGGDGGDGGDGRALDAVLQDALRAGAPGMILRVEGPGLDWSGAAGRFALDGKPLQAGDPFRIASVTKTVTAVTVLRLAEDGRLGLDDPLARFLPSDLADRLHVLDGRSSGAEITVRQLLAHTNGLHNYITDDTFTAALAADPARSWRPIELVEHAIASGTPDFPPGTGFHYNDTGFVVAGLVVEAATGRPLGAAYRALVFDPLDMADTYLEGHDQPRGGPVSHAYVGDVDLALVNPTFDWAGGGLVSTAEDLRRFLRGLFGGGLLTPGRLAEMTAWTPSVAFPPGSTARYERYGLGIGANTYEGLEFVGSTGAWGAFAYAVPARDATVTGTVNRLGVDRDALMTAVARVLQPA